MSCRLAHLRAPLPVVPINLDRRPMLTGLSVRRFTCTLYNDASTYTIDLTPFMTQGGASLSDNVVGAGYVVVMNGDPLTVSNNDTNEAALYNQSLWAAVLFWPGDQYAGAASNSLTVYWPGAFPSATDVKTLNQALPVRPEFIFLCAVHRIDNRIRAGSTGYK